MYGNKIIIVNQDSGKEKKTCQTAVSDKGILSAYMCNPLVLGKNLKFTKLNACAGSSSQCIRKKILSNDIFPQISTSDIISLNIKFNKRMVWNKSIWLEKTPKIHNHMGYVYSIPRNNKRGIVESWSILCTLVLAGLARPK